MKHRFSKELLRVILAFVLVIGLLPVTSTRVAAQNIIGLMHASGVRSGEGIVLMGDTTLNMDTDLTVPSIEGDYNLTIQGSGKLTVNGSGNGIDVKSLECYSDLYIQTDWHAIDVDGKLTIQNNYLHAVGGIYADDFVKIVSSDATIAGNDYAIYNGAGGVVLDGTFAIGARKYAIYTEGYLSLNGNVDCNSTDWANTCIYAVHNIETATSVNLKVRGSGGIFSKQGHIMLSGDTIDVEGTDNTAICASAGDVTISANTLAAICMHEDIVGGTYGINAEGNVNLFVTGAAAIAGNMGGIHSSEGNINLTGNFTVGADYGRTINAYEGAVTVNGSLKSTSGAKFDPDVHFVERDNFSIGAAGGFNFYGTTLEVEGLGGILAGDHSIYTDISITADSASIITERYYALYGENIYVDSDELWLENQGSEEDENVTYDFTTVFSQEDVTLYSESGGIVGENCVFAGETLTLNGTFAVVGDPHYENLVITVDRLDATGVLMVRSNDNIAIEAEKGFSFNGSKLDIEGHQGIVVEDGDINIVADSVVIATDVGEALCSDEVYVTANYLWAENKATKADGSNQYGIAAESKLALNVEGGTVIGYDDALHVYDENDEFDYHYIYVDGNLTVVSKIGAGMYVPQGIAELYGGPIVSVGETHGIYADDVYFDGGSLRVDGNTGIYAASGVELSGEDIQITAFGERNSGIWCENGYVDLEGKVTINTNGWYGVNAGGDLTLGEGYFEISGPEGNAQAVKTGGKLTLDSTLEIVKPTYGHVNGNDIYGAGNSPAQDVLIYSAISDVSLLIDPPRAGELPTRNASGIYFLDPRCTVEDIVWYEDGVEMVSQDAVFRAGHHYTVEITISADGDYYFLEGVMGKVNDKSVSTGTKEKKIMYLTAELGECPNSVDVVELEITAPVEGKTPSTYVAAGNSTYGVYSRNVRWSVSTDGINYYSMATGEKFVGGKYYRVFMDVNLAGKDYKFPVTTVSGSVQPDVVSYVNGNPAVTEKAYDQDPETVITVYFDFGKCNDFIIEEIDIVDVVAPVAGEHPSYTANVFGTGYHVDTTKNAYEDIYWKNPPEKWYFMKNGISWWDVTDGGYEYVYENDVFLPGHQYRCEVQVRTDDGYEFVMDLYTNPETWPTATMNGNSAELTLGIGAGRLEHEVAYTFTCEQMKVSTVQVDLDAPQAGKTPADCTLTTADPNHYTPDVTYGIDRGGIFWYDSEGNMLDADEPFVAGKEYKVEIKLVPTRLEGVNACTFVSPVSARINGKEVVADGDWDNVYGNSNVVYIYYTFTAGSNEKFNLAGANLELSNDITMYFYVYAKDVADGYYMEIVKSYADGSKVTKQVAKADWKVLGDMYYVGFNGIAAKEMADNIAVTVYNAKGVRVSNTTVTSVSAYALRALDNAAYASMHTLMADLLNYGAAAQTFFKYNTSNLANANMTETHKGYATKGFDMADYTNDVVAGPGAMGANLSLETNILQNFYFNPAVVNKTMTAKVTYTNYKGVKKTAEISGDKFGTMAGYGYVIVEVAVLAPADVMSLVSVEIVDTNGNVVASVSDSISSYAVRAYGNAQTETDKALYVELMEYALSCEDYFG